MGEDRRRAGQAAHGALPLSLRRADRKPPRHPGDRVGPEADGALNFDRRRIVLQYDNVLNEQREIIYKQRREVLFPTTSSRSSSA
ncbi:hypothetical protein AB1398_02310 [Hydrogenibacillus schlegelii]